MAKKDVGVYLKVEYCSSLRPGSSRSRCRHQSHSPRCPCRCECRASFQQATRSRQCFHHRVSIGSVMRDTAGKGHAKSCAVPSLVPKTFLTGLDDILKVKAHWKSLEDQFSSLLSAYGILVLHFSIEAVDQQQGLNPSARQPCIILATNIAEFSSVLPAFYAYLSFDRLTRNKSYYSKSRLHSRFRSEQGQQNTIAVRVAR